MNVAKLCAALAAVPLLVQGQELRMDAPVASMDIFRGVISQVGNGQNGLGLCLGSGDSVGSVRLVVEVELKRVGVEGLPTPNQVLAAMRARFPCPFTPYVSGFRPAGLADLEGAWTFAGQSARFMFPPRSAAWTAERALPLKCEAVGYFPDGEARTIEFRGSAACPMLAAGDFAPARSLPRVATWSVPTAGRLVLTRSDVPDHVEEWEVFVVDTGFDFAGVAFRAGDLVQYLRKSPGVASIYAMKFRHLQRLP